MSVRVRYAPSPTGSPHVGNIRTALLNHLLARRFGGVNIVRMEDTDRNRYVPGCGDEIIESLRWIGCTWQEGPDVGGPFGPYHQSERKAAGIYEPHWQRLLDGGFAYKAFDTPEELEAMREFQQVNKQPTGYYGGEWRDAGPSQVAAAEAAGQKFVVRLKIPRNATIVCDDTIRGRIEFDSNLVDDPVLIKADGMPTYHFAAMVDDHLMEITHVIRGEEWISSAPKHIALFQAFDWAPPLFVHVPVIKGKDGSKLSKRHGDTAVLDFRRSGYLPEALANFIALIGWAPGGDRELMSMDELAEAFDLKGLQPSSGIFDLDKLTWMNGHYIRAEDPESLFERVRAYAADPDSTGYWRSKEDVTRADALDLFAETAAKEPELARQAVILEQERVTNLSDFGEACAFFFQAEPPMDEKAVDKWFGEPHVPGLLEWVRARLQALPSDPDEAACEAIVREAAVGIGIEKIGPVVHPLRVALTGKTVGPGLWQLMAVLGRERMVARLDRATGRLRTSAP